MMNRIYLIGLSLFMVFGAFSCKQKKKTSVISKVQQVAKLATTETIIDKTVVGAKTKRILGLVKLKDANFVAYTQATVWTGIDMQKLHPEQIEIKGKEIRLKLPPVEVIDFQYPFNKFEVDTTILQDSWLNRFEITDYENFYRQAERDIRRQLVYTGVVEATQNKTRLLLKGLLQSMGFEAIFIEFEPTTSLFKPVIIEGIE